LPGRVVSHTAGQCMSAMFSVEQRVSIYNTVANYIPLGHLKKIATESLVQNILCQQHQVK